MSDSPARPTSPPASWRVRLGGLFAAIVLVEILLRLFDVSMPPAPLYPGDVEAVEDVTSDPLIGWKLPPDAEIQERKEEFSVIYRSDGTGFRSPGRSDLGSAGRRIVFVGDSYTFGTGVSYRETFAARVGEGLEGAEVFNLGIGGFGVDQMWLTLENYGLALDPELVVLSFIRNDLDRTMSAYRLGHVWQQKPLFRLGEGGLERVTEENRPGAMRRWFEDLAWVGLWRRVENSASRRWPVGYRWALNRAVFERVRDLCSEAGVRLLVVHIPVNRLHAVPMFEREFAAMKIEFLDLASVLPDDGQRFYYPVDRHFNAAGHAFAGDAILERLARLGWSEP